MRRSSGVVILDATCIGRVEDPDLRERIVRSLRAVDFAIWPTTLNVVEVCKTQNARVRRRGLATIEALSVGKGLLPLPHEILRDAARALRRGDLGFESALYEGAAADGENGWLGESFHHAAVEFTDRFERARTEHLEDFRTEFQRLRKQHRPQHWHDACRFLEEEWLRSPALLLYVKNVWEQLELEGNAPPLELLLGLLTWRLFLEAEGMALFERLIARNRPKRVGFLDLSQLIYLGAERRRILVTDDKALQRAASVILHGRYADTRVEDWCTFLSHHS